MATKRRVSPLSVSPSASRKVAPYDMIKSAILAGKIEPGTQLVETSLAAWCGVSRTPIREALQRLEQDGLVVRSDRGLVVRERSPEEILDIYETRIVLEATASRVAAERRTEYDLRLLRRQVEQTGLVNENDVGAMVSANQQFHHSVWRASHNESLIDLLTRLDLHILRYPGTTLVAPGRWLAARREHQALVDAIEARDSAGAYSIAMKHFEAARDIRLKLFEEEATP